MTSAATIELAGVTKVYGGSGPAGVRALRGINLRFRPGQYVSIEGPSGCGKTTLLNLLGLIDTPTEGEVRWDGVNVADGSERERARFRLRSIGFVFQRFYLLPTLTVRENVELPLRPLVRGRAERRARATQLLESVGLGARGGFYPSQLSGGEEQRVAIARALVNSPALLLADEPTGELDSDNAGKVLDLLEALHRERQTTLIVVTHNPEVARRARRHLTLRDGRVESDVREEV
ncbi:MAG: ABC transporter ATP-binding protein [Thermoplasmata archaeon]|jgi:putative ABC transport system ATP-binding protein